MCPKAMQPVQKNIYSCENDKEDQHSDKTLIFNIGYSL